MAQIIAAIVLGVIALTFVTLLLIIDIKETKKDKA